MSDWSDVCPLCQKDDQVQKVTSIVAAGQASGSVSAGYYEGRSSSQTDLSKMLSFPSLSEPESKGMGCLFLVALVFAAFMVFVVANTDSREWASITPTNIIPAVLLTLVPVLCIVGMIVRARGNSARRERFKKSLASHERMRAPWQRLYYCYRNGVVFLPDEQPRSSADARNMMAYLGAHA